MRQTTLRNRVVTWYVGLLAAALILLGGVLYLGVQQYLNNTMERSLSGRSRAIAVNFLAQEEEKGPEWMAGEIAEAYAPEMSGRFIRITRQSNAPTGEILYASGDTHDRDITAALIDRVPFNPEAASPSFRRVSHGAAHVLICSLPFVSTSGHRYTIETAASQTTIERGLSRLRLVLLVLTPVILLAAALGGRALMTLPLRPLVTLTEQAERIGAHEFGERLPVIPTGDEMERLSLSLNRMISRLEDALSHNRRFSADVSHELRTPLTILRGELEALVQLPTLSAPVRETVGSALEEIERMGRIVESLLAIARLDSGTDLMERRNVDLGELARRTADQMHLLAEEKQIAVELTTTPTIVHADPARLKQVLVNLIDNAMKYTPAGGRITMEVEARGRTGAFTITDTGHGIAAAALPYVFDRFFRTDKARSRVSGGSGLGLSIVNAIVKAHDGTIDIQSTEGLGTIVRVDLPLSTSSAAAASDIPTGRPIPQEEPLITR